MDKIREYLKNPLIVGIASFLIGVFIGLVVLGWGPLKVQYYDAAAIHLRHDLQIEWMTMSIQSYAQTGDAPTAIQRYKELQDKGPAILAEVEKAPPAGLRPEMIQAYAAAVGQPQVATGPTPAPGTKLPPAATATPAPTGVVALASKILPLLCGFLLLVALALAAAFLLRRPKSSGEPTPAQQAQIAAQDAVMTDYVAQGEEPPMAQFMASYKVGDDLFDDSFSIDSPSGEFLGECGVGISDTIGVGDPKRVTAFEVWLFDKNDIQTVTKVIMSAHAFSDETIRQKLAAKGEPVLASPGQQVVLETATLQLVARVVDMGYGEGPLPPQSFFDNMILELAVWPRQA